MKIKHTDIEIEAQDPFGKCKLNRKSYALVLSEIINTYTDGFVLAINNEWGTGKTTFVKMWQQMLNNEGYQTIYFNAWENDFNNNPLVALMAELETFKNRKNEKIFKSIIEKGAIIGKSVLPSLIKSIAKRYIDIKVIIDAIENASKGATEILKEEIEEYTTKKKTVIEFKKELEQFIENTETDKPLIFIIDELDRCRPNYSVEVLEQVKHFFSVKGIVFVLSIDKNHLASAIKGYYGSEQINTDEYLRRFIDLEYSIPKPSHKEFCNYLYDYYSFNDFFVSDTRIKHEVFDNDAHLFLITAELLFKTANSTLRQQEKIFALTRLVLCQFKPDQYVFSFLLFILVYIKTMKIEFYEGIKNHEYTLQQLCDLFETMPFFDFENHSGIQFQHIEAYLLHFYNNDREIHKKQQIFIPASENETTCTIKSKQKGKYLETCLEKVQQQDASYDMRLDYLLKKIDLLEPINEI